MEAQLQFRHPARVKLNCLCNIRSVVIETKNWRDHKPCKNKFPMILVQQRHFYKSDLHRCCTRVVSQGRACHTFFPRKGGPYSREGLIADLWWKVEVKNANELLTLMFF